jgi:hypothetical protein
MISENELELICNEAVVVSFEVISYHLPGGTKDTHKKLHWDSQYSG